MTQALLPVLFLMHNRWLCGLSHSQEWLCHLHDTGTLACVASFAQPAALLPITQPGVATW